MWASLTFPYVGTLVRNVGIVIPSSAGVAVLQSWSVSLMDSVISLTIVGFLGIFLLFFGRQIGEILALGVKILKWCLWKLADGAIGKLYIEGLRLALNYYVERWFYCTETILSFWIGQKTAHIIVSIISGKGLPRNGTMTFIEKFKAAMHKGLLKKTPWLAVILSVLPIPVVGEVVLIAIRTFVWAGSMNFRTAMICLAITCPIRSYLWCALIVYHRFG